MRKSKQISSGLRRTALQQHGAQPLAVTCEELEGMGLQRVAAEAVGANTASYCMVWQLGFFVSIAEQVLYHTGIQDCLTDKSQRLFVKNLLYRNDKLVYLIETGTAQTLGMKQFCTDKGLDILLQLFPVL